MRNVMRGAGGLILLGGLAAALLTVVPYAAQDDGPQFSAWSQAVAAGPPITTKSSYEACPFISKSGLDLYFRTLVLVPGTTNTWRYDIFVSHRDTPEDPWEPEVNLGPKVNTGNSSELCSFVTNDGHWIYFASNRPDLGSRGGNDIFVAYREDKRNDTGWGTPVNLGPWVNSATAETGPSLYEDEATGESVLYFTSGVGGTSKIFSCRMLDHQTVAAPATAVAELNSTSEYNDLHAFVRRRDGLEVIFASDRDSPTAGLYDLFVSTRPSTLDPWSTPVKLGPEINTARSEARPSISWDGTTIYFWTDRERIVTGEGGAGYWNIDVYHATRTRLPR